MRRKGKVTLNLNNESLCTLDDASTLLWPYNCSGFEINTSGHRFFFFLNFFGDLSCLSKFCLTCMYVCMYGCWYIWDTVGQRLKAAIYNIYIYIIKIMNVFFVCFFYQQRITVCTDKPSVNYYPTLFIALLHSQHASRQS